MKIQPSLFVPLVIGVALLSACEKPAGTAQGQMVAKVAGERITASELNLALSRLGELSEGQQAEARAKVLQALVDQRLVVEAARKAGLDKEPDVALAMAQASRQALAEAFAERLARDLPAPTDAEIADYYAQHPELFAQRRIYRVQELELKADAARAKDIEETLKTSQSLGDFVAWVKAQGIESKTAVIVRPAEQIPAPLLARLSQMRDGQVTLIPARPGYVVIHQLVESQLQPASLEQARAVIERALVAQKRKERLEAEVKKLREATPVEYAEGYAPAAEAKPAPATNAADKPAN